MLRDCCTDTIFVFFVDNKNYVLKHQMQTSIYIVQFSSVQFSRSLVSDSLRPHESQHARPPCPEQYWWAYELINVAIMENPKEVPQKIKSRTTILSKNSNFRYISKGNEIPMLETRLYFHVHCSIIYNSQDMETM